MTMFSGIIENVGSLTEAVSQHDGRVLKIATGFDDLALGESVAVNGVCLTVTDHASTRGTSFFASPETLKRSNLGRLPVGAELNLERAITLATRLSGHLVQGHVDGKASLATIKEDGGARQLRFLLPKALYPFCVEKGSIALNGVSLTINGVDEPGRDGKFSIHITIIPHTWEHTNLHSCRPGDEVNVEVDVLAKYVERLCRSYVKP
jgi:riboflavin synthase